MAQRDNEKDIKMQNKLIRDHQLKLEKLHKFLLDVKDHVGIENVETIFQVLQSHGKIDECI
jgi:uncharacterized protein YeeX (DUF496 family)